MKMVRICKGPGFIAVIMLINTTTNCGKERIFGFERWFLRFFRPFVVVSFRQLIVNHYNISWSAAGIADAGPQKPISLVPPDQGAIRPAAPRPATIGEWLK